LQWLRWYTFTIVEQRPKPTDKAAASFDRHPHHKLAEEQFEWTFGRKVLTFAPLAFAMYVLIANGVVYALRYLHLHQSFSTIAIKVFR
jgi:hypothetical protein